MSTATACVDPALLRSAPNVATVSVGGSGAIVQGVVANARRSRGSSTTSSDIDEIRGRCPDQVGHFSGEEILENLLANVLDEPDAKHLAQTCIRRFGSLGAVFKAKDDSLIETLRGENRLILFIRSVHRTLQGLLREPLQDRPVLRDVPALHDYLRLTLAHETQETCHLLFLDTRNALLKDEIHARGTVNHTPIYPREVLKRVIEVGASAIIIAHNHPSGDPSPSQKDVDMTILLKRVLNDIGVELHDHVVVGKQQCHSMRSLRLI